MRKMDGSDPEVRFYRAFLSLKTPEEVEHFLNDLCTINEIQSMVQRFEVARLLSDGQTYQKVEEETGASTATISRVKRYLDYGDDGYRLVLERMAEAQAAHKVDAFRGLKTWAVVGATDNPDKFGFKLYQYLKGHGYRVYPVNPNKSDIMGEKVYPNISALPEVPDAADVVIPPALVMGVLEECKQRGVQKVWLQPGAESQEAVDLGRDLGLTVVAHKCIMAEGI